MPQTMMTDRPDSKFIADKLNKETWVKEVVPASVVGLTRDVTVYRAERKTNLIKFDWHGDKDTFCPPVSIYDSSNFGKSH